jgi:hypothetical protein
MPNNTNNEPGSEALHGSAHFQALASHTPRLAHAYLTLVSKDYAAAKPEHQRAYLAFLTKERAEHEPESEQEAPKELSALNKALCDALDYTPEARQAILEMRLSDSDTTKLISKTNRQQIAGLSGKTSKPRRRILKNSPAKPLKKPRL